MNGELKDRFWKFFNLNFKGMEERSKRREFYKKIH